jgi:hypothetical protein
MGNSVVGAHRLGRLARRLRSHIGCGWRQGVKIRRCAGDVVDNLSPESGRRAAFA